MGSGILARLARRRSQALKGPIARAKTPGGLSPGFPAGAVLAGAKVSPTRLDYLTSQTLMVRIADVASASVA
jgi:hypothetical protein